MTSISDANLIINLKLNKQNEIKYYKNKINISYMAISI
jgi:hypothetical protein